MDGTLLQVWDNLLKKHLRIVCRHDDKWVFMVIFKVAIENKTHL